MHSRILAVILGPGHLRLPAALLHPLLHVHLGLAPRPPFRGRSSSHMAPGNSKDDSCALLPRHGEGLLSFTLSKESPLAEQELLFPAAIVVCYGEVAAMRVGPIITGPTWGCQTGNSKETSKLSPTLSSNTAPRRARLFHNRASRQHPS